MASGDDERAIKAEIHEALLNQGVLEIDLASLPAAAADWRRAARAAGRQLGRPVKTYTDDEYAGVFVTDFPRDQNEYAVMRRHLWSTILLAHGEYAPTDAATTPWRPLSRAESRSLVGLVDQYGELDGDRSTLSIAWRPRNRPLVHWLMLIELFLEHEFGNLWVATDIAEIIVVKPYIPDPSVLRS